jgi:flagellar hook-associated protein 3 FlgL
MYTRHLGRIASGKQRVAQSQDKIATGRRVNRPSDDPAVFARVNRLRHRLVGLEAFNANAAAGSRWLGSAETALDGMGSLLSRARELVTQGLNGTLSATNRETIALEVGVLRDQMAQLAETSVNGQYVFSGTRTDQTPLDTSGNYVGGQGAGMLVEIGESMTVELAVDGKRLLDGDVNIMKVLDDVVANLNSNDVTALGLRIEQLGPAEDQVLHARAGLGARMSRIDVASELTSGLKLQLQQEDSQVGDTDMAQTISDLMAQEASLSAAVQMAGRALQPSLMDVMR